MERLQLSDFQIGRELGKGKYGLVYLCRRRSTKQVYAMKVVFKDQLKCASLDFQDEVNSHAKCSGGPHIVKYFSYFEDDMRVYIFCEYIKGKNLYLLQGRRPLPEKRVAKWLHQLLLAVQHCHEQGIVHRDIKPENIMITNNEDGAMLVDFGCAIHNDSTSICNLKPALVGTVDYLCPTRATCLLDGTNRPKPYGHAADIWSLGVVVFEMLTGHPPFETPTLKDTWSRIAQVNYVWPDKLSVSEHAKDIVDKMLQCTETDRISCHDALMHPFLLQ